MVDCSPDTSDAIVREYLTQRQDMSAYFAPMGPLSDELLARIVALAADAIICINAQQTITFFNDGATRIFGYANVEIMGHSLEVLIPTRFQHAHSAHIFTFGHSAVSARQMGERSLISGVRKNGEEFPAEAAIAKMIGPDGPIYSVVLRDVTEQRRTTAMNERLLADSEAALRARDEVLGLVSHDLRNPVNAVKMLAAAILRSPSNANNAIPAEVLDHASVMLQAANQMDALIQDLLDVTRLEAGRLRLNRQPVAVLDVVNATIDTLRPVAEERSIAIEVNIDASLPLVDADPDRLLQVLSNLVGNAIKFSTFNSVLKVSAHLSADFITVAVIDSGVGISADELPFVFDRFWQSKRTNRSGAGLGLAIARGIVQAHGGDISVDSVSGQGTTVRITVPVAN